MRRGRDGAFADSPLRRLDELRERTCRIGSQPHFVDRVMALVRERELGLGHWIERAARRCVIVCGLLVVLAAWWALRSRETVAVADVMTNNPLETTW